MGGGWRDGGGERTRTEDGHGHERDALSPRSRSVHFPPSPTMVSTSARSVRTQALRAGAFSVGNP